MKEVLISIQPKWCELIASGKKTVEVRKTRPKLETPFKCYIYCTQGLFKDLGVIGDEMYQKRMKVIGEFVCDQVGTVGWFCTPDHPLWKDVYNEESCLSNRELYEYSKGDIFYEWNISDLVIYDKPRELSEFWQKGKNDTHFVYDYCAGCIYHETPIGEYPCNECDGNRKYLYRPPQSWCYVESEDTE